MTASESEPEVVEVHPQLICARSLRAQIELVGELLGPGLEARRDVLEEWLERLGYGGDAACAALQQNAAQAAPRDRWHAAILRALLLQPRRLRLHCAAQSPERPRIEWIAQELRRRYPLREVELVDTP